MHDCARAAFAKAAVVHSLRRRVPRVLRKRPARAQASPIHTRTHMHTRALESCQPPPHRVFIFVLGVSKLIPIFLLQITTFACACSPDFADSRSYHRHRQSKFLAVKAPKPCVRVYVFGPPEPHALTRVDRKWSHVCSGVSTCNPTSAGGSGRMSGPRSAVSDWLAIATM